MMNQKNSQTPLQKKIQTLNLPSDTLTLGQLRKLHQNLPNYMAQDLSIEDSIRSLNSAERIFIYTASGSSAIRDYLRSLPGPTPYNISDYMENSRPDLEKAYQAVGIASSSKIAEEIVNSLEKSVKKICKQITDNSYRER